MVCQKISSDAFILGHSKLLYVFRDYICFKINYISNLTINDEAWGKLRKSENLLNRNQQNRLAKIAEARQAFLSLPQQMFEAVEGERAREDLFLFRTETVPLAETMLRLLNEMTVDQQDVLQTDLNEGREQLAATQRQILAGGVVAFFQPNFIGAAIHIFGNPNITHVLTGMFLG